MTVRPGDFKGRGMCWKKTRDGMKHDEWILIYGVFCGIYNAVEWEIVGDTSNIYLYVDLPPKIEVS